MSNIGDDFRELADFYNAGHEKEFVSKSWIEFKAYLRLKLDLFDKEVD